MILHTTHGKVFKHVASINHEGKVVLAATDDEGGLWYTIKQDGFEDSYLQADPKNRTGWEKWSALPLPGTVQANGVQLMNDGKDDSVIDKEIEELTVEYSEGLEELLLQSRYDLAHCKSAVAPVKLISGLGHLYVFRQAAKTNSLLVDRFVVDGMTNKLVRKLEVRFKRTGQKYKALQGKPGQKLKVDSLDFRDADNLPFFEPTKELSLIKNLKEGWFDVVLVPTNDHDVHRWHFFFYESTSQQIEIISIKSSSEGLFDFQDTKKEKGIIRRKLELTGLKVTNGPAATKYDIQKEKETERGSQLLREATRIMLAIPTDKGTAAISFALSSNGTLSQIEKSKTVFQDLRSNKKEIFLPLNTLDEIRAIKAPAGGDIIELESFDDDRLLGITVKTVDLPNDLKPGDYIKISKTQKLQGNYKSEQEGGIVEYIPDENCFVLSYKDSDSQGFWTVVESEETSEFSDGDITWFDKRAGDTFYIEAPGVGVKEGDSIRLEGSQNNNGVYEVVKIGENVITLRGKIQQRGRVINIQQEQAKRRGMQFNAPNACIVTPILDLRKSVAERSFERTFSVWIFIPPTGETKNRAILSQRDRNISLELVDNHITFWQQTGIGMTSGHIISDPDPAEKGAWIHYAIIVSIFFDQDLEEELETSIRLLRFGSEIVDGAGSIPIEYFNETADFFIGGIHEEEYQYNHNDGPLKIADVQIWNKALSQQEIKDNMYRTLTGKEFGLVGYWRLGGIIPGETPTVVDFSVNQQNAVVYGDAFVAAISLDRHLKAKDENENQIKAGGYENEELFAVTSGATYTETFDFKVDNRTEAPDPELFTIRCWGKKSRGAEEDIQIDVDQKNFKKLKNGWFRASCEFISEEANLIRSFGIAEVKGDWKQLHIRNHHINYKSDSITEEQITDNISLETIGGIRFQKDNKTDQGNGDIISREMNEAELLIEKRQIESFLLGGIDDQIKSKEDEIAAKEKEIKKTSVEKSKRSENYWAAKEKEVTLFWNQGYDPWRSIKMGVRDWESLNTWSYELGSFRVPDGLKLELRFEGGTVSPYLNDRSLDYYNDKAYEIRITTRFGGHTSVDDALNWWYEKHEKVKKLEEELSILRMDLKSLRNKKNFNDSDLAKIIDKLEKLSKNSVSSKINADKALEMKNLGPEDIKLQTKGALLEFVQPATRIQAYESCEGKVQLSYIDKDNRLRQTNFHTTKGGLNSQFEKWLPEGGRSCFHFNLSKNPLVLPEEDRIKLRNEWTISAWVSFPLDVGETDKNESENLQQRCLASSEDGQDGYIVAQFDPKKNKETLGFCVDGKFHDSGIEVQGLMGWHHLTLVSRNRAAIFYLDGNETSAIPSLDKVKALRQILEDSSAEALQLADAIQTIKERGQQENHADTVNEAKKVKSELEKNKTVKEQAQKINTARKEALAPKLPSKAISQIGMVLQGNKVKQKPFSKVAELSFWDLALSKEEVEINSKTLFSGHEPGLIAYYPMTVGSDNKEVEDKTGNGRNCTSQSLKLEVCTAQIGLLWKTKDISLGGIVSIEYSTIFQNPKTGLKSSMMRRCLVYPINLKISFGQSTINVSGIAILADKRIEELELLWIGNAQFNPTLLGYIEGAPPVPSENLTVESNYNDASSVMLSVSEDVAYSWARSDDSNIGLETEGFIGHAGGISAGIAVEKQVEEHRAGLKANFETSYEMLTSSEVSSESSIQSSDSLSLRGTLEQKAKFPHLGKRFIPKNIGYALVVSALADVFISRLKRSMRMIGYQTVPVADIPPDFNTITFLINPAYTMAGSLDGMTGSSATSDRFFKHVPEMRAQYGSQYPASFFRLSEAYDLKHQIEMQDKNREAYFANFNARLVDTTSLDREVGRGKAPSTIGITRKVDEKGEQSEEEKKKAEKAATDQQTARSEEGLSDISETGKKKNQEIKEKLTDLEKRNHAQGKLASWQKKMEAIQIRAGKRNIVNNYVWDADGGMRCEAQSFANTAEHMIGGSFSMLGKLGGESEFNVGGFAAELTAQITGGLTQTMSKTQTHSKGFSLEVDVSGVESTGVTDHDDYPLMPGEKVDRYRFMSFYLEGSTKNFNDFFDYVVDPEWLASNDEEARALRQAKGKANKTWRVLHRVTYVERPALMGFGRDLRPLEKEPEGPSEVEKLNKRIDDLKGQLSEIIKLLKK